ncbi:MAG: hypothetical protein JWP74_3247 [Marmoricola sp.]|nr:hypothetical protein [Marmoricola sp.]
MSHSDSTDTTGEIEPGHTGVTRRTIIRTGANAAWAVPLITVATTAPALAASGSAPSIRITNHGIIRHRAKHRFTVHAQVTNVGDGATTAPVVLTLTMPKGTKQFALRPVDYGSSGHGWEGPSDGGPNDGPWTWTFLYTPKVASRATTTLLEFVLHVHPHHRHMREGYGEITFNAMTAGSHGAPSHTSVLAPHRSVSKVAAK